MPDGKDVVKLFNGKIEIHNGWFPGKWNLNKLIDNAEEIEEIKFVNLETVLLWKERFDRPKDRKHVKMIRKYLKKRNKKSV